MRQKNNPLETRLDRPNSGFYQHLRCPTRSIVANRQQAASGAALARKVVESLQVVSL
jgi:hypothetical protein